MLVRDGNPHGLTYRIGFGRKGFYGLFQDQGTKHQPARPFVAAALEAVQQRAVFQVGEKMGREIDAFAARQPKIS
jgi:HK97 gp10 family phage protein